MLECPTNLESLDIVEFASFRLLAMVYYDPIFDAMTVPEHEKEIGTDVDLNVSLGKAHSLVLQYLMTAWLCGETAPLLQPRF